MKNLFITFVIVLQVQCVVAQDLDLSFGNNGIKVIDLSSVIDKTYDIDVSSTGKIFVSGTYYNGTNMALALIKLTQNGSNDLSFDDDGIKKPSMSLGDVSVPILLSEERLLVSSCYEDGTEYDYMMNVLDSSEGNADNTFNTTGELVFTNPISQGASPIQLQIQNNKYLLLGTYVDPLEHYEFVRINTNGSIDVNFGTNGYSYIPSGFTPTMMIVDQSNNILLTGEKGNGKFYVYRFLPDGTLDNAFGSSGVAEIDFGGSAASTAAIKLQSDGKIIVAGDSDGSVAIARLTSAGILDLTFDTDGKQTANFQPGSSETINDLEIDPATNDILVCGYSQLNSEFHIALARFSSTGLLEDKMTIKVGDGISAAKAMKIQTDRKIILTGTYNSGSDDDVAIVRILPDFSTYIAVGTTEPIISQGINVFPNPASNRLNIHSTFALEEITIQDMFGKTLLQTSTTGNTTLDISSLSKGVYNCFVKTSKGTGIKKVVIQ